MAGLYRRSQQLSRRLCHGDGVKQERRSPEYWLGKRGVRVAYSRGSLTQGRMGITVASFMQEGDGLQGRGLTIIDPPKDGDCLYPTFVQPDVVTTATLYWIESSGTQLRVDFVFHGVEIWTYPSDLSAVSWEATGSFDAGDYRGTFPTTAVFSLFRVGRSEILQKGRIEVQYG